MSRQFVYAFLILGNFRLVWMGDNPVILQGTSFWDGYRWSRQNSTLSLTDCSLKNPRALALAKDWIKRGAPTPKVL